MAFPLVSLLFQGVEYHRPSLNPFSLPGHCWKSQHTLFDSYMLNLLKLHNWLCRADTKLILTGFISVFQCLTHPLPPPFSGHCGVVMRVV